MPKTLLFAIVYLLSIPLGLAQLTNIKLNPDYSGSTDIAFFLVSPDGTKVVYRANQDVSSISELYSVPLTGGTSSKLNGPVIVNNGGVTSARISSTSLRVVYDAKQDTESLSEIYSVSIEGGDFVKLNAPLVSGGLTKRYLISVNGETVVYRADQEILNQFNIYSVPIAGGTPVQLNQSLNSFTDVRDYYLISPDNARVVYLANQENISAIEMYSVDINGGTPVKLNTPLGSQENVGINFKVSPNSDRVVYLRSTLTTELKYELYSVPITGGTPIKLNGPLVSGGDVDVNHYKITPDGAHVVYLADQDTDDVYELYSVPIGGGTPVKLNGPMVAGGDVELDNILITSDNATVIYRADQETNNVFELYSVPLAGGTPSKINSSLVTGRTVNSQYRLSHDNVTLVYLADQDTDNVNELYSAPVMGGTVVKLNAPLISGGDVIFNEYEISFDDNFVVYKADQEVDQVFELYRTPLDGGAVEKLNGTMVTGGFVTEFKLSPNSNAVVYRADQDIDNVAEVYVTYATVTCSLFIDCPEDIIISTDSGVCSASNVSLGVPVTSNCPDELITNNAPSVYPIGDTEVIWEVTDGSGTAVSCVQLVSVQDLEAPIISCPLDFSIDQGDDDEFYEVPNFFNDTAVLVLDNCTDPVALLSQIPSAGTLLPNGIHLITLNAEDDFGNVGSCSFEITVDSTLSLVDQTINLSSLVLFSNPASQFVTLQNPEGLALEEFVFMDISGRTIDYVDLSNMGLSKQLDISALSSGLFMVKITSGTVSVSKQLIVQN